MKGWMFMKKIIKRSISLLIILSLILSVLPVEFLGERSNVLAATSEGEKYNGSVVKTKI